MIQASIWDYEPLYAVLLHSNFACMADRKDHTECLCSNEIFVLRRKVWAKNILQRAQKRDTPIILFRKDWLPQAWVQDYPISSGRGEGWRVRGGGRGGRKWNWENSTFEMRYPFQSDLQDGYLMIRWYLGSQEKKENRKKLKVPSRTHSLSTVLFRVRFWKWNEIREFRSTWYLRSANWAVVLYFTYFSIYLNFLGSGFPGSKYNLLLDNMLGLFHLTPDW